jgi:hypothetical protein
MKSLYSYLPASAMRKIGKFLLFYRNLKGGKKGNAEQQRKYWDGIKAPVQQISLYFLASKD